MRSPLTISQDLTVSIGGVFTRLTVAQGLKAAEDLARKSLRRALTEEGDAALAGLVKADAIAARRGAR